jgi:integrase
MASSIAREKSKSNRLSSKQATSFRIGRVLAHQRGEVWYLRYSEDGRRQQPRVGHDRELARRMAAEINAQLESGAPSLLGFEPVTIAELRQRWLDHHEHIRRSSVNTIKRYRAATSHLVNFVTDVCRVRLASDFRARQAEEFVKYLRGLQVTPNGHKHAKKRPLRDAGIKFILETCCSLFNYASRQRHLSPYAENPFRMIEVSRIPVEDAKPVIVLSEDQERRFWEACDAWQFPIFVTLMLTGLRPGELIHLLLPDNLDLESGWLRVRNKPRLGWQVKTRNEREIPLVPALVGVLRQVVGDRRTGPVFRQRRCCLQGFEPSLATLSMKELELEVVRRISSEEAEGGVGLARADRVDVAAKVWRDAGGLKYDWVRKEFKRITKAIGSAEITAPKTLRHGFATALQDANVDPLIRNELMGHAPASFGLSGAGLGMTAVYTHTRPETKRKQLEQALEKRQAAAIAAERFKA